MKKVLINQPKLTLVNNFLLKIVAVIFGYAFWLIFSQNQIIQITQAIPLSFNTLDEKLKISAPENIVVQFAGKRSDLQKLDPDNLSVNLDIQHLTQTGIYPIAIDSNHIFLPKYVKLLYYTPVIINLELN